MSTADEVLAVRYGTRATRKSEVYLHFDAYGEPDADIDMDYFFWVVRVDGDTTLVDTGFNEASGGRRKRTMLCPPREALARLGVDPGTVTTVVLTHGHYDHIGNLGIFPAAEFVMARREYAFWTGPMGGKVLFAHSAETGDVAALRTAYEGGRVRFVDGRATLPGGIELVEVGGHTPGQLIVLVGDVVVASDALHYYEELDEDRPFTHVADLPAMYGAFERLRGLGGTHRLIAGHDPDVMRRFPVVEDGLAARITLDGR
ncbi:N-acyl homoserine lactonase family protein [Phytohabitans suffuscus]|uniref:MBL fold hydrolase n=1 Tax=Phytohabitans suffuscus TaxID=624315 RepID=A0A6F8YTB9_9ACTN|nr:N-acyl homoserine lactonase family protein [Phytohabitans suffuscus]BCB89425.1 MBL fold hydrolase [Phytohabitans suffuscus]